MLGVTMAMGRSNASIMMIPCMAASGMMISGEAILRQLGCRSSDTHMRYAYNIWDLKFCQLRN
jgi:hypothetical protein